MLRRALVVVAAAVLFVNAPHIGKAVAHAWAELRPRLGTLATPQPTRPFQSTRPSSKTAACPVAGRFTLSSGGAFGACRDGCSRRHQGLDLFAAQGTPVIAVVSGTIARASMRDQGLGGISLTLRGPDGTTYYYAHHQANRVGLGARVHQGQSIAAVGRTGNARSTPAHLHFEIHPHAGAAIDPAPSIRRWCR
jgi:murein DD-endopeptidase MepM/ murein hydrolase activator NlpD